MYEKPKEKHGFSRVREGPGAQVGATWATKSRPRGVRTAKTTSNKVAGGVRAVKVGPVRLDCLSELWNEPQPKPDIDQARGQSLYKRSDI